MSGTAEVCLQVTGVVPAQGRDAITAADAEPGQRASELVGTAPHLAIAGAGQRAIRPAAHHLRAGEETRRPVQQLRHRERVIHHQAIHRTSSDPTSADAALTPSPECARGAARER